MLDVNRCIWITGASTGIGRMLVKKLASKGFTIAASARSLKNLNKLRNESKNLKNAFTRRNNNLNKRLMNRWFKSKE